MIYRYTRNTFREGKLIHTETKEIDGARIEQTRVGKSSRQAFLELVNWWNSVGLLGLSNNGPLYIFTAE